MERRGVLVRKWCLLIPNLAEISYFPFFFLWWNDGLPFACGVSSCCTLCCCSCVWCGRCRGGKVIVAVILFKTLLFWSSWLAWWCFELHPTDFVYLWCDRSMACFWRRARSSFSFNFKGNESRLETCFSRWWLWTRMAKFVITSRFRWRAVW